MQTRLRPVDPVLSALIVALATSVLPACSAQIGAEDETTESASEEISWGQGQVFDTGGAGLNVRASPNTWSAVVDWLPQGGVVNITCQTQGQWIDGYDVWNFLGAHGGYVSDRYLYTGYDGFIPGIAKCGSSSTSPAPSSGTTSSSMAQAAVNEARKHTGYTEYSGNCNKFSYAMGNGCVEWCADFVRYVWNKAGASIGGLSAYSMTFHDYGVAHGTWKPNVTGVNIKAGDAIVWGASDFSWGAHVAMVTEVSGSSFRIIHGNFHYSGAGQVYETGWVNRWNTAGTGYNILGFTSPVK